MGAGDRQTNRCNTSLAGFLRANALMNDPERYEIAFSLIFSPFRLLWQKSTSTYKEASKWKVTEKTTKSPLISSKT